MPDISDLNSLRQDLVAQAVDTADSMVGAVRDTVRGRAPALERVADLVPDPSDVVDQVTATANELLALGKDVQHRVVAALTANA